MKTSKKILSFVLVGLLSFGVGFGIGGKYGKGEVNKIENLLEDHQLEVTRDKAKEKLHEALDKLKGEKNNNENSVEKKEAEQSLEAVKDALEKVKENSNK